MLCIISIFLIFFYGLEYAVLQMLHEHLKRMYIILLLGGVVQKGRLGEVD